MRRNTKWVSVCAAAASAAALVASNLSAAEVQWRGGDGNFADTNYTVDGVDTRAPANDFINFGLGSTIAFSATPVTQPGRIRVGHNFPTFSPDTGQPNTFTGPATLNFTAGNLALGGQETGALFVGLRAGLVIGYNADGTVNVSGGTLSSSQRILVGVNDTADAINNFGGGTATGTLNITGGTVSSLNNNMIVGQGNPGVVTLGGTGTLNVLPTNTAETNDPDLNIGGTVASTYTQTGGTLRIANNFNIAKGSTASISGGQVFTKVKVGPTYSDPAPAGNIFVGRDGSSNDTLNISGSAEVNVGNRFLQSSAGAGAINSVVNQSGGTLNVALAFVVCDLGPTSTSTYNLSGGTITTTAELSRVGRRGDGKMFQTGGSAMFGAGLAIGDDADATVGEAFDATGLYEITAGELHTNIASGDALRIGSAGNGTFRVIGDDGVIDVNGNFSVGNTTDGVGNLAYRFDTGDLLSTIDVSGAASFAAGSTLSLDSSVASPTQTSYDLLTATTITDNGIAFTGPAGWSLQIVPGLNGQILRAVQAAAGGTLYWDTDAATPGAGGASPAGNWDGTATNFTADAAGGSATTSAATTANDDVVFAAGTDGAGAYTVTVSGTQSAKSVQVARGNVTFAGGTIATPAFDVAAGATAVVSSGAAGGGPTNSLTKTGTGTLTLSAANAYTGGTTVSAGTLVLGNADATAAGAIDVADGALAQAQAALPKAVTVTTLATHTSGKFDLTDNSMVIKGMDVSQVRSLIQGGFNAGHWNGATGLDSSTAAANALGTTAIGYATAGALNKTVFKGVSGLTATDVLVKYTYYGDADLSGATNLDDFTLFLAGYQNSGSTWSQGDFDYSGATTLDDFTLFLKGYQQQGAQLSQLESLINSFPMSDAERSGMLAAVQAVPEPGTAALAGLAGVGLLANRRRRRSSAA